MSIQGRFENISPNNEYNNIPAADFKEAERSSSSESIKENVPSRATSAFKKAVNVAIATNKMFRSLGTYDIKINPATGKFDKDRRIGKGGGGVVYHATKIKNDTAIPSALKVARAKSLDPESFDYPKRLQENTANRVEMEHEIRNLEKVNQQLVGTGIKVQKAPYKIYDQDGHYGYIGHFYAEGDGDKLISMVHSKEKKTKNDSVILRNVFGMLTQFVAVKGLGWMLRDIKPGNFLSENKQLVISDWGKAREKEHFVMDKKNDPFKCSPGYFTQEDAKGCSKAESTAEYCDAADKMDVFAMGVTMHKMITGEHPYTLDELGFTVLKKGQTMDDIEKGLRESCQRLGIPTMADLILSMIPINPNDRIHYSKVETQVNQAREDMIQDKIRQAEKRMLEIQAKKNPNV